MESMNMTRSSVNGWGLYQWSPEHQEHHGAEMIHPNDLANWNSRHPYGGYFECLGVEDGYLVLGDGKAKYRVKSQLYREVDAPCKRIGDVVEVESKGQIMEAVVVGIQWHHQKSEPFYLIEKDGKQSSKQYWSSDFR